MRLLNRTTRKLVPTEVVAPLRKRLPRDRDPDEAGGGRFRLFRHAVMARCVITAPSLGGGLIAPLCRNSVTINRVELPGCGCRIANVDGHRRWHRSGIFPASRRIWR